MHESEIEAGNRAAPRLCLNLPGKFMGVHGLLDCTVTNLSRIGASITLAQPLAVGAQGYLKAGPIDHFVFVVRHDAQLNALEFENPVDDRFVLQMRRFQESWDTFSRDELDESARAWIEGRG